jgi:predicted kinase
MTLINLGSGNLINLELQALEADSKGKVVSSPRVVTGDNQKASIEQGTEIPYTTSGGLGAVATTSFKKAVLRLEVTPQITPDNRIIMGVEIRKDSVGANIPQQGGGSVPSIDTRNVITQISVNNGDTAVIGGIFEENINTDVTKVPILGDIPFLGYLFKTTGRTTEKIELLSSSRRAWSRTRSPPSGRRSLHGSPEASLDPLQCLDAIASRQLFLVGLPGAGNPRSGRQLARRLDKVFVDADTELERKLGVNIPTIFEIEGEASFRDREEAVLAELVARTGIVLATGGGVVIRPANRERLKAKRYRRLSARRPRCAVGARAQEPPSPAAERSRQASAARRALPRA